MLYRLDKAAEDEVAAAPGSNHGSGRYALQGRPHSPVQCNCVAPDVAPTKAFGPVDFVGRGIGAVARLRKIATERGHAEHTAAIGDQALVVAARSGVKDLDLRIARGAIEATDLGAAQRLVGIAVRRHDNT